MKLNDDRLKLKHDFLNSVVIINSMTASAANLINEIQMSVGLSADYQEQLDKITYALHAIRQQAEKIKNYVGLLQD